MDEIRTHKPHCVQRINCSDSPAIKARTRSSSVRTTIWKITLLSLARVRCRSEFVIGKRSILLITTICMQERLFHRGGTFRPGQVVNWRMNIKVGGYWWTRWTRRRRYMPEKVADDGDTCNTQDEGSSIACRTASGESHRLRLGTRPSQSMSWQHF